MSISLFPTFKLIHLEDKQTIDGYYRNFLPYSDFNFSSLYIWNENNAEYCFLHDNLVIKMDNYDYDGNSKIYSFLGQNKLDSTIESLLVLTEKIQLVPEDSVKIYLNQNNKYNIIEDKDNHDYIYSLENIRDLKGGEFKKKRYSIKNFNTFYHKKQIKTLNFQDDGIINDVNQLLTKWYSQKKFSNDFILKANERFSRFLKLSKYNSFECIGIYVNSELSAFSINEIINNEYAIQHYFVTDWNIEGLSDYLFFESIKKIPTKFLNNEQDGGFEGLRKFKKSWRPVSTLKKFTITRTT